MLREALHTRARKRQWIAIIVIAVLFHVLLILTVREGFFSLFSRSIAEEEPASGASSSMPQAIIVIPVEAIGEDPEIVQVVQLEEKPKPPQEVREDRDKREDNTSDLDVENIVGEAQNPLPSQPGGRTPSIPPRPIEITWPETRKLQHCRGIQVDIRIHVGKSGQILDVRLIDNDASPDCLEAALDAARKIVFEPGKLGGKPVPMWTQVRIDFRKRG